MVSKSGTKGKKHQILGGIKVSSQQLSKWGKLGGRPQKWTSEAERKRAERLRKKQKKLGKKAEMSNLSWGNLWRKKEIKMLLLPLKTPSPLCWLKYWGKRKEN